MLFIAWPSCQTSAREGTVIHPSRHLHGAGGRGRQSRLRGDLELYARSPRRAGRYQTIGLAGFGVGAIGLGLYYLLTAESDGDTQAQLQLILAPTYAGVRVQGTY